jgi:DNA-binding Lrp family transcriptional regulator
VEAPTDDIDEKIIRCLIRFARSTYAEIGKAAGLSAPAAKRRLDRLVASGAIRGFTQYIAEQTTKTRVSRILQKLHLRDRVQAVVFGYETDLVKPGAQA